MIFSTSISIIRGTIFKIKVSNFKVYAWYFSAHLKISHSEKATQFWWNLTVDLLFTYLVDGKSNRSFYHIFVAFSEYINFKKLSETRQIVKVRLWIISLTLMLDLKLSFLMGLYLSCIINLASQLSVANAH